MALPKWITTAGNLGVVPELEYYEFPLDADDASGGTLTYFLVSGKLPVGLQIVGDKIAGVPISQTGPDINETYTFTIRVRNVSTGGLNDRTFELTITNIAPPIINNPPRNTDLGLFLDGTTFNIQLESIDFGPSIGYVDGQAYYGPFHTHLGRKMVGAVHTSTFHQYIYNTAAESMANFGAGGPIRSRASSGGSSPAPIYTPPPSGGGGGGSSGGGSSGGGSSGGGSSGGGSSGGGSSGGGGYY